MNLSATRALRRAATVATICATTLASPIAHPAECTATSGPQRIAILELYTSEGCDSCPPAEKWVSELPSRKLTGERVIPLAFHVDYWNQLGWIDPYSQAIFSARQRQHSNRRGISFVVTPQLLLNGQDFRPGVLFDGIDSRVKVINRAKPQADIRVNMKRGSSELISTVDISVPGGVEQKHALVYLALYENNLVTTVNAGENKGRTLKHDFVVRSLAGPLGLDDKGNLHHTLRFTLDDHWKPQDLNLAVFVQQPQTGDVLQALLASCP